MTRRRLPDFESYSEECDFWAEHSLTEFDLQEVELAEHVSELKRQASEVPPVLVRLDEATFDRLNTLASQRHTDCAALVKEFTLKELELGMKPR